MVNRAKGSPSPPELQAPASSGFLSQLVNSIFEPGANAALVLAMNVSFFMLLLVLFALAFLTGWNKHVLALFGISGFLWATMVWFVMELSKVQTRTDNMPVPLEGLDGKDGADAKPVESKKDR